jgi:hypothetical protein
MLLQENMAMASASSDEFTHPVVVLTSFGRPTAIGTAMEAHMVLVDWPRSRRGPAYEAAAAACLAALRGETATDEARACFVAWAQERGILAPETGLIAASRRSPPRRAA